jgi:pilus assembly protein CpaC
VLLRVRFAELDRTRAESYGVNWFSQAGQTGFYTSTQQSSINSTTLGNSPGTAPQQNVLSVASALNIFAFDPKLNLGAFLSALQTEDILQILAEPNLVTTNGKEAYFLVGGEFPVPVLQGGGNAGAVTIQFKEFGIRLRFTPVITGNGTIKLHLAQEVSTLDVADGVTFNGFVIRRGTRRWPELRCIGTARQPRYGELQQAAVLGRYSGARRSFQE